MRATAFLVAAIGILACSGVIWFLGRPVETYRDANVIAGEITRPLNAILAHSSNEQYLIVHGKTYRGIRGIKPFYLVIPGTNEILFVTESSGRARFHVVDLHNNKEVEIDGGTSGFGGKIGFRKPGEIGSNYLENLHSNRLAAVDYSYQWKQVIILNLDSKLVEREDIYYLDSDGAVTKHIVIPGEDFRRRSHNLKP